MLTKDSISLGIAQYALDADIDANRDNAIQRITELAANGANIVILPELHDSPYWPQQPIEAWDRTTIDRSVAAPEYIEKLCEIARSYDTAIIVPTLRHATTSQPYRNCSIVIDRRGTVAGEYTKTHIPNDPGFYEQQYFEQGVALPVFDTGYCTVAPYICFDQWFPEVARTATLKGADLLVYSTALGTLRNYQHTNENWPYAWRTVQQGHAIANGVHVAAVNRCGYEGTTEFFGQSFVCDAFGTLIYQASEKPNNAIVSIDLAMNRQIQEGWGFLQWRNVQSYEQ